MARRISGKGTGGGRHLRRAERTGARTSTAVSRRDSQRSTGTRGRQPSEHQCIVVKLGGSLGGSADLKRWMRIVARAGRPVVIVPGGGAFADAVRAAQARQRFSDAVAHRMAILAMHQTALMLIALEPRLVAAETVAEMRAAWASARIPVWLPLRMADRDRAIPADWSTTSDGLAARLAERLGAAAVCLVKARCVARAATAIQLAGDGVVDPQFPIVVGRADLVWRVLGPGEERQLARALGVPSGEAGGGARAARSSGRRRARPVLGPGGSSKR